MPHNSPNDSYTSIACYVIHHFQLSGVDEVGRTFVIHRNYVNMEYGCTQGSYTDVNFMKNTTRIFIDLIAPAHRFTTLAEIEIFEGASLPWQR